MRAFIVTVTVAFLSLQPLACKPLIDAMNANAEANRSVTVVVEGAVFGPHDARGQPWEGQQLPPESTARFLVLAASSYPAGGLALKGALGGVAKVFAADIIREINAYFVAPDALGTVAVVSRGNKVAEYDIPKRGNTFTPEWSVTIPDVGIHRARVVVNFWDRDVLKDRHMAKIVIKERELLAAEESGGLYALDTVDETNGAVLRLIISVYP